MVSSLSELLTRSEGLEMEVCGAAEPDKLDKLADIERNTQLKRRNVPLKWFNLVNGEINGQSGKNLQ